MSKKSERLFEAIGDISDKVIDEAAEKKVIHWKMWAALAALIALVAGAVRIVPIPNLGGGAGGAGSSGMSAFMSYAGPVMPLTLREENGNITAERNITLDFMPWDPDWRAAAAEADERFVYSESIMVTDAYTLSNTSNQEQTVSVLYPFSTDLYRLSARRPVLTVDGTETEAVLHAGSYSGRFFGAWGSHREGLPEVNLAQAKSWEAYQTVLADGSYQAAALEDYPDFSHVPVVLYEFLDPWGQLEDRDSNRTIRAGFTVKIGESTVLTTGFHGGTWDQETGEMTQSFTIPRENERTVQSFRLVVLGEDLLDMTVNAYDTGGPSGGSIVENAGVTVRRTERDLESVLREIAEEDYGWRWNDRDPRGVQLDFELFFGLLKDELAAYYQILDDDPGLRYADVLISESDLNFCNVNRVFYLETQLTIPAGGNVALCAEMLKDPSFDYTCANTGNRDIYGYDLLTRLGSNLICTRQSATLEDRGLVEIVRDNFGFDLNKGLNKVELSPDEEHYYLEAKQKK